jgi:hypothetical protein
MVPRRPPQPPAQRLRLDHAGLGCGGDGGHGLVAGHRHFNHGVAVMRAGRMHRATAPVPQSLDLWPPPAGTPLPVVARQASLAGFAVGDRVLVKDITAVGTPGYERPGRVMNVSPKAHLVHVRLDLESRIVSLNPLIKRDAMLLRHRPGA